MAKIKIDSKMVNAPEGISVLSAAMLAKTQIPYLCYREGTPHFTSCMVCVVKDAKSGKLFPSCSVKVVEGMEVVTMDDEIREARQKSLELLLSEHVGDCEAPCQITCPAHMDIPAMNRLLKAGKIAEALEVVRRDIAMPAVFGRICPAPCEGACHRKRIDEPVSICLLKRFTGDALLEEKPAGSGSASFDAAASASDSASGSSADSPILPDAKKIAVLGAGAAGLAAAWYLQQRGYATHLFFRGERPGGSFWSEVESGKLEEVVLRSEIEHLMESGIQPKPGNAIDAEKFTAIQKEYDAVVVAIGEAGDSKTPFWNPQGLTIDRKSHQLGDTGVFVVGSAAKKTRLAIRAHGHGKEVAFSIDQYLSSSRVEGEPGRFNSRFGKLQEEEFEPYLLEADDSGRIEPTGSKGGYTLEEIMQEAARCMHCDCRAIDDCKLRELSEGYGADQRKFWPEQRKQMRKVVQHRTVIYEPSKCIKCGICVRICEEQKEPLGLTFIGRGFDVEVGVPFNKTLNEGLKEAAEQVVKECPTGALSNKEQEE